VYVVYVPIINQFTTIDWYDKWPREALLSVSRRFLRDVQIPTEDIREALAETCVDVHTSVEAAAERFKSQLRRIIYITPKSYLDLISNYSSILAEKRNQLATQRSHLAVGLNKLKETNSVVGDLQIELEKLQPVLAQKAKETEQLMVQIQFDQENADKVRAVVEEEEKKISEQRAQVRDVQAEAKEDLDRALPILEKAVKALDNLKKNDISEVKMMQKPPAGVVKVMEAVCILLQAPPDWENAKKVLANVNFLKTLKEYDKDNIDGDIIRKLQKYVKDPDLEYVRMKDVSLAAASLMEWVKAVEKYFHVSKVVGPKKAKLEQMNALLKEANAKLKEKQDQLAEVNNMLNKLKENLARAQAEMKQLSERTQVTKDRRERAEKLTKGLSSEDVRWTADLQQIDAKLISITGNAFLSAACLSYNGAFTGDYRKALVDQWVAWCQQRKIPSSPDFSLVETLGSPLEIRQWNINGLPTDDVSIDSGLMARRSFRWPLMIDPQEQAKKWIKNEHKNKILVTRFVNKDLMKMVEQAVKTGSALLIEDVTETVEASIDPVLLRQIFVKADQKYVRLGEQDIEYHDKFRLYLTTKMANPHYLPEAQIKVTLLNFTVTRSGLEDQLLGEVVKKERPEVEHNKNNLIQRLAKDRRLLSELEDRILLSLSEASGNILDDQNLVDTLEASKTTSNDISERVKASLVVQKEISAIREQYRPVAIRGSILYFVVANLALVDPMYEYSLAYFMRLFNLCLDQSEASTDVPTRLENIMKYMTLSIFSNIQRGLFQQHKLIFSFLICGAILRESKDITFTEWNLLVRDRAGGSDEGAVDIANPFPELISDSKWKYILSLDANVEQLKSLALNMSRNPAEWKAYIEHSSPHTQPLPAPYNDRCTAFQRLLVLKSVRPEKLLFALHNFVADKMGQKFVQQAQTSLEDVYKDTDSRTPIVFVLSQGADPQGLLFRFAKEKDMTSKLQILSLGQGQGEVAIRMIEEAKVKGQWVLMQNCHLAKSFMSTLEEQVETLANDSEGSLQSRVDDNFRLWLTSMPCDYFPVSVLQKGVKVTNEPPSGLRANLVRSFTNIVSADDFEKSTKPIPFKKLLFGLCFFHAIVQERKKFGPLGWNKVYEFNDSDLETGMTVLRGFLDEQQQIPWDALRYVVGEITYGGRVTDDMDRRCLNTILSRYFTPNILNDKYTFSPSGTYYAPATGPLPSYIQYLESLPITAEPEVFGMHENANLTYQRQETDKIMNTILSIQPRDVASGGGKSSDDIVSQLAEQLEAGIPELLDRKKAGADTFQTNNEGLLSSLATVLIQEMDRFNRLLNQMRRTLGDLQRAIRGEVVMSLELDKMYTSLLNNQVPQLWQKVAYPSLKPLASWYVDLLKRVEFFRDWLVNGTPTSFWLSGFFFPQGFLTAVLQTYSRKYRMPIDTLTFSFTVLPYMERKEIDKGPSDGVYIEGLFLDGCKWDKETKQLEDSNLGQLFSSMPIIHFLPTKNYVPDPKDYACPVYKTSVRAGVLSTTGQSTNYVLSVYIPTDRDPSYWVLKGAAMLTMLDS